MNTEKNTYEIYYDKEGDFLEVSFEEPAKEGTTEEIESGIFITKDIETGRVTDIGILDFKKRVDILARILIKYNLNLPLRIDISD
nr:DUF2283 domain-containing protein [Candidatus Woesearchaeota archaeon]